MYVSMYVHVYVYVVPVVSTWRVCRRITIQWLTNITRVGSLRLNRTWKIC